MAAHFTYRSDEIAFAVTAVEENQAQAGSWTSQTLFRWARIAAVIAALATAYELVLLGDRSAVSLSVAVVRSIALIPIVVALHQLLRTRLSEIALELGVASNLRYIAVAPLVALGLVSRWQERDGLTPPALHRSLQSLPVSTRTSI